MNTILQKKNRNEIDDNEVLSIARRLDLTPKFVELLFSRGFSDEKSISAFLSPNVANFYDPYLMKGMREAVERINSAIENKEKIVIYGDYDADGICANAILSLYFSSRGIDVYSHTPNRFGEDYGLNIETLDGIIESVMPDLIITCDCGISCAEEVEYIQDLGVDVIVTDHHEVGNILPDCTIINPKQTDCLYPYKYLCGAGVALKLVQALSGYECMEKYLDLCAVATIADLVPLTDENRLIVQLGLKKIPESHNIGLQALFDSQDISNPTSSDIAFKISPRINAAGRMGDAYRAFELLTSHNRKRVLEIIEEINAENERRKQLCSEMYEEAVGDLVFEDIVNNKAIILSHPTWEKGITGIVAAKLCGDFHRPTIIMVKSGDSYKGTCRSVDGINIYDVLSECAHLLNEFGGHSQAAGFSIDGNNIPEFKRLVNDIIRNYDDSLFLPKVEYDIDISESDVDYSLFELLEKLEPTGNSNPKPLFKLSVDKTKVVPCRNNSNHVSITTEKGLQIFAFNYALVSYQLMGSGSKEIVIELQKSIFGENNIKGLLRACRPENLFSSGELLSGYFLTEMLYTSSGAPKFQEYDDVAKVYTPCLYGTLVIASSREEYEHFVQEYEVLLHEYAYITNVNNYTRIIVAPELEQEKLLLYGYNKIIFLKRPYDLSMVSYLNSHTNADIYIPKERGTLPTLCSDKRIFMQTYGAIKRYASHEYSNIYSFYKKIRNLLNGVGYEQFIACLIVFKQIGIINIAFDPFMVELTDNKADLGDSELYRYITDTEGN